MLKTLADCKPSEFIKQTSRIRKAVKTWADAIGLEKIRAMRPVYETLPKDRPVSAEERVELAHRNKAAERQMTRNKLWKIVDMSCDEHPEETLVLLAACCFVEPEDVDKHTMAEYLGALARLIQDEAVIDFFISLSKLGQMNILPG